MLPQNDSTAPDAPAPAGKRLFGVGMLAVGIAAGAMFAPASFAGAQDDADNTDDAAETDTGRSGGHRGNRGLVLEELGIDVEAVQAGIEADQTFVEIAAAAGVSEADLIAALEAKAETRIATAVENGRMTQAEADEKLAELSTNIAERVNTPPSERPERENQGHRGRSGEVLEELGLTVEDIQTGREAGQTLAETAAASGVSEADLVSALVAQATERAETALEEGRIDADRAAEVLDGLDDRITERVNAEPGDRPERGDRGPRGQRGNGDQTETEDAGF